MRDIIRRQSRTRKKAKQRCFHLSRRRFCTRTPWPEGKSYPRFIKRGIIRFTVGARESDMELKIHVAALLVVLTLFSMGLVRPKRVRGVPGKNTARNWGKNNFIPFFFLMGDFKLSPKARL